MPEVKSTLFHYISGKSGNHVFRQMNGKTFYSIRPYKYNISQSEKARSSRSNFSLAVKFARLVNSEPILKLVWKKAKVKGTSPYHKIIKYNIGFISGNSLSLNNAITPRSSLLPIESCHYLDNKILFRLNISRLDELIKQNEYITLSVFIFSFIPKRKSTNDIGMHLESVNLSDVYDSSSGVVPFEISRSLQKELSRYNNLYILASIISNSGNFSNLVWSSTFFADVSPLLNN